MLILTRKPIIKSKSLLISNITPACQYANQYISNYAYIADLNGYISGYLKTQELDKMEIIRRYPCIDKIIPNIDRLTDYLNIDSESNNNYNQFNNTLLDPELISFVQNIEIRKIKNIND